MICPHCSAPLADDAKFCGICGQPLPTPKPRRWKPWMTVTTVVVASVLGAGLLWATLFGSFRLVTQQMDGFVTEFFVPSEKTTTAVPTPERLRRTWSMVTTDLWSQGEAILWVEIDEDEMQITQQTADDTQELYCYYYYMVDQNTAYVPELDAYFTLYVNQGGNLLTISPGLVTQAETEYWFNFN